MAKHIFILAALMVLQMYIEAAPNTNNPNLNDKENLRAEQDVPKLDSEPYGLSEAANEDKSTQGQRQKRFNNYFSFGFSPYESYSPNFVKRDESPQTGNFGAEVTLSIISRQVLDLLNYTRQRAFSPPPIPQFSVPYIPVFYIPHSNCNCIPNNNEKPVNDEEPSSDVPSAPPTTPRTINNPQTMSPATDNVPTITPPDDVSSVTIPDFSDRSPETNVNINDNDYEDGARPISFNPILPNKPLGRPPPPVDHGINQAGGNSGAETNDIGSSVAPSTMPPLAVTGVPAQPNLPTNSIPTLCDGAVLTCCHRLEVTYDCFVKQGCPNPTPVDNPCDENAILEIIRKFEFYYANRRG